MINNNATYGFDAFHFSVKRSCVVPLNHNHITKKLGRRFHFSALLIPASGKAFDLRSYFSVMDK